LQQVIPPYFKGIFALFFINYRERRREKRKGQQATGKKQQAGKPRGRIGERHQATGNKQQAGKP
jgi:hypothetical protein